MKIFIIIVLILLLVIIFKVFPKENTISKKENENIIISENKTLQIYNKDDSYQIIDEETNKVIETYLSEDDAKVHYELYKQNPNYMADFPEDE